jgi:hypothetical protein
VNKIENGEWLQYTINISENGNYTLHPIVSAEKSGGKIVLAINNLAPQVIDVPETGGIEKWQTVNSQKAALVKGKNVIRVKAESGGYNFKSLNIKKSK